MATNKKIVFIGSGGCGKTSLVGVLNNQPFKQTYQPTHGVELTITTIDNVNTLNIWDCAGQEKFEGLGSGYYKEAHTIVICFTSYSKLETKEVDFWYNKAIESTPNVNIILVGTKTDSDEYSESITNENLEYLEKYNLPIFLVSSVDSTTLRPLIDYLNNH